MSVNFKRVPAILIKRRVYFTKWIAARLKKTIKEKELPFTGKDIYENSLIKIACGKRKLKKGRDIFIQFKNILRSTAYNEVRKYLRRNKIFDDYAKEYYNINPLPDLLNGSLVEALNKLKEWIVNENQVELYFLLDELAADKKQKEIAEDLHISVRRIKYLRNVIAKKIRSFL